jgi:glycogen debranching enzyme
VTIRTFNGNLNLQKSFSEKASRFTESTEELARGGINPGGYYKAVWARDASFILKDWFLSGMFEEVMREIFYIWSHQITAKGEKVIYGRGSPEMKYLSQVVSRNVQKQFSGALPTTIFHSFSEIYGQNPDIDSTALMISTTSWIFDAHLKSGLASAQSSSSTANLQELEISPVVSDPSSVMEYVISRMLKAVDYLATRDIDHDGLLEQGHNEDWMDTVLRAGKIVYSQACWILALRNLSSLLSELGRTEQAHKLLTMAQKTIQAVEQKMWLDDEGTYIDLQESHHLGASYKTLTQDVSLYLTAVTENTLRDVLRFRSKSKTEQPKEQSKKALPEFEIRGNSTLDAIKSRIWKGNKWPLVTEVELKVTGPWILHPNQYHNHTFWPWTTGIEMLARSRFGRLEECDALLSVLTAIDSQQNARVLYEWINPITDKGQGAFPFRTGISAVRIAIADILNKKEINR